MSPPTPPSPEPPTPERPDPDRLALVRFRAAGYDFALPAARVQALTVDDDPAAPDLTAVLGLPLRAGPGGVRRLLTVVSAASGGLLRVRVEEPVTRLELPAAALQPVPVLLAARLRLPALRALALSPPPVALLLILTDPAATGATPVPPSPPPPPASAARR